MHASHTDTHHLQCWQSKRTSTCCGCNNNTALQVQITKWSQKVNCSGSQPGNQPSFIPSKTNTNCFVHSMANFVVVTVFVISIHTFINIIIIHFRINLWLQQRNVDNAIDQQHPSQLFSVCPVA